MSNQCAVASSRATKRVMRGSPFKRSTTYAASRIAPTDQATPWGTERVRGGESCGGQDPVDDLPQRHRLALADEEGPSRGAGVGRQRVGGQEVGAGGVLDVGRVDLVGAVSDAAQRPRPTLAHDPWHEVGIPRAPDQMRPQGQRAQRRAVGRQDRLLPQRLGRRVVRMLCRRIRGRLVHAFHRPTVEDHARGTGVDQPVHALFPAGCENVPGAAHVGFVIRRVATPDAGLGGDVKHDVAPGAGRADSLCVPQIAAVHLHAQIGQTRIGAAGEAADLIATSQQQLDDRATEEPAAAGDQRREGSVRRRRRLAHQTCPAAQTASVSRTIFEL